jgi:TP901 family phage tail tape measure protein
MADETISTRIVANADFSALIADVHKVTASLSRLQEQLANSNKMLANNVALMNRNFADTLRSTGQYSTHFVSLTSDVEKFGKNLDGGRLKLRDYFGTFQQHVKTSGGLIRELARQQVAMQNAVLQPLGRNSQGLMQFNVHVPRGLDQIKNKTAIARQELQIMNRVIQDGAVQLINWGKNTQWAGRQLTVGLTLPIAAFGKAAADAFKVADQELTRLTKVYGDVAGTTAAELGRVREDVIATSKELSRAYGTSFTETISLAADIAATGKKGQELLDSVKETSRLAVLGEVDRQEAMKATLAIQTAFQQNTDQLAESINFLNAVENQTSTSLADLVEAIPKAGPVVQQLGGDVQDLALYMTAMREGGVNASEGANALKSGLAALINPTKQTVGVMSDFGIDILSMVRKNTGDTTAMLFDLQAALDNLDPLQKAQAIEQLFGKFQFARISALLNNLGRQGSQTLQVLDLMKVSASDLEQVAARELTAVTESASGKYKRAIESLRADLAGLGDQFLTIATTMINIVDKALKFFEGLPKPIKQAITFLGALTALAGPLIMITGVLANFFGYILKGIMHMKAFFKGGEGWKYLTPEMLAADKAGKLVEQTFYSDAKAAAVLQTALRNLIDEFSILEAKAKGGAMAVNPAVSTLAGNVVMGAGVREVVAGHPLAGTMGTRASTHMVPRAGLTEEQRMQQTIFGLVPGSIPVNRKIGDAPQIYMNQPLPPVPGLTQIGGVSTGVVSGEAARWHAMMATLAMQSKAEIETLKKQIATTGVVSKDFMQQFDDILPIVSGITDKAATQSALIVAELRAGKINIEQARAQIISLNLEIERMIGSAVSAQAATMGRTINPTIVPTLNQPVVDASGKSNMRELFKKSKTRDLIDKVSRSLGVRTSGAGYNIETTRPKRMNMGGYVYTMNDGNIVPGPNINKDVVPAVLTPGEFVVNREATAANLPLLQAINSQSSSPLPIGYMPAEVTNQVLGAFGQRRSRNAQAPGTLAGRWGMIMPQTINDQLAQKLNSKGALGADLIELLKNPDRLIDLDDFLTYNGVDPKEASMIKAQVAKDMASRISPSGYYADGGFGNIAMNSTEKAIRGLEARYPGISLRFQRDRMTPGRRDTLRRPRPGETQAQASARGGGSPTGINYTGQRPSNYGAGARMAARFGEGQVWGHFADQEFQKNTSMLSRAFGFARRTPNLMAMKNAGPRLGRPMSFRPGLFRNSGGMIMGYNRGGMVQGYNRGGMAGGMGAALAGTGLMMAGQSVGGTAGSAMNAAGLAMSFMPMLGTLPKVGKLLDETQNKLIKPIGPAGRLATSFTGIASRLTGMMKIFGPVLKGIAMLARAFNPLTLGITATIFAVKKGIDAYKAYQETLRINRLEYGLSSEAIKNAGYKLTDYNANIKKAIEDAKALQERNKMLYESMFQANIPIKMTIAEYKKLREEVKKKMPDLIELFNQKSNSEVRDTATNLKAQFMALGDNVETATAKVFALMSQSNKAQLAAAAIGSDGFSSIKTAVDAAVASAGNFDKALKNGDAKAASDALIVTFEGIGNAIEENAKKNKIEFSESMDQVLAKMQKTGAGQKAMNASVLAELKKQNPEIANILNATDTATSAWAKYQLALQGVNLDLKTLSAEAAQAAVKLQALVVANTVATLKNTPGIDKQYAAYGKLQNRIKDLQKAAKGQSVQEQIDTRKVIESLNKRIAKIKEAADAKIKAIRAQRQAEDDNLEIQKLQLEYQQALARGDKDAAAQAQIAMQQKVNDVQSRKAEENILAKAELEIKPLQDKIDALGEKNQKLADKAALAGESLGALQSQAATLKAKLDGLEKSVSAASFNKLMYKALGLEYEGSEQQKTDLAGVESFNTQLGGKKSVEKVIPKGAKARHRIPETFSDVEGGAKDLVGSVTKGLENGVNAKTVNVYTDKITGSAGTSLGGRTKDSPLMISQNSSFAYTLKKDGQLDDDSEKRIIRENQLEKGQFFKYNGITYEVLKTGWGFGDRAKPVGRSLGGPVTPGRQYLVNDRINALGKQQEVFMPTMPGIIKPNINTAFNIPSNTISRVNSGMNNSYNNNTYNIDIDLNGTNVTADDIMRRFKSELALINAKEGRVRTVGGNY